MGVSPVHFTEHLYSTLESLLSIIVPLLLELFYLSATIWTQIVPEIVLVLVLVLVLFPTVNSF